ncbi:MAG: chromate efflux transporter [Planctomycetota bacterium]
MSYTATASPLTSRLREIATAFSKLGLISFGGPVAHISYLHDEFVTRRAWLEDEAYVDLVALCQFLPGPASSQIVFALGMRRAGIPGALLASLCFTLPSAILMIAFAYGVASVGDLRGAGWLHGLKLMSVAVVAQAVWGMGKKLCPDRARLSMCLAAAAILIAFPGRYNQIGVLAAGALLGWLLYRTTVKTPEPGHSIPIASHLVAAAALLVYVAILLVTPFLVSATGNKSIAVFDSFYRAGALVFGGGHVVLPLLREETVARGWLSYDQFIAGYGAVQAVPGPLFTFSAYLGTIMSPGPNEWLGGLWCVFAIFLPAWLLIGAALPFWDRLRSKSWTQAALRGANATVVGVLLAALYSPVMTEAVKKPLDVPAIMIAFGLLDAWKAPPWLMVFAMAAVGHWLL